MELKYDIGEFVGIKDKSLTGTVGAITVTTDATVYAVRITGYEPMVTRYPEAALEKRVQPKVSEKVVPPLVQVT